jgi:putative membrane protein
MLQPTFQRNDKAANIFIITVSLIVFMAVTVLAKVKIAVNLPFDVHLFALANAILNTFVAITLIAALWAVRQQRHELHKKLMLTAIVLSVLFLLSYIAHHLFTDATKFGDLNHDGILSEAERLSAGTMRIVYYVILLTHIPLAGIILPFILFTAYRALTGEYTRHKKLARITWPVWFYVAVSGVVVYLLIQPYY